LRLLRFTSELESVVRDDPVRQAVICWNQLLTAGELQDQEGQVLRVSCVQCNDLAGVFPNPVWMGGQPQWLSGAGRAHTGAGVLRDGTGRCRSNRLSPDLVWGKVTLLLLPGTYGIVTQDEQGRITPVKTVAARQQ
jgi:hypothetical protein